MNDQNEPVEMTGPAKDEEVAVTERQPRLAVRILGLAMVVTSVFLATYLIVGYAAFESGKALGTEQGITALNEQLTRQLELARQDWADGSENLALTRLDWILSQDPDHAEALALRAEVVRSTTVVEPSPVVKPDQEAEAEATEESIADDLPEVAAVRRLVQDEKWTEALPLLLSLQQSNPSGDSGEINQLLYDTYLGLGIGYISSGQIELGLNYLSQAERLGSLTQEALDYRVWADLYFQAVAYSGVNWELASGYWRDLCAAAPFFQDACSRFDEALANYGDQLAYQLDWCPAVSIYEEAWNRRPSDLLDSKIAQAREGCALATPIPVSGTITISQTTILTGTAPITPTEPGE